MMKFSETIEINRPPQEVFTHYANVKDWSKWDSDVEYATIENDFKQGAIGTLKAKGAPKSKILFIEVTKDKSFTTLGKLPLCKIYFEHQLEVVDTNTTKVTHIVIFDGLLAPLFGRMIGRGIQKHLPNALLGLKDLVETGQNNE